MSEQAAHFLQGWSSEGRTFYDGNQRRVSLGSSGLAGA
jgi:hypothetical protein